MDITAYDQALDRFEWLRDVVLSLPDQRFSYDTPDQIAQEKSTIISQLTRDAAFALLSKLDANLHNDFRNSLYANASDPISSAYRQSFGEYWRRVKGLKGRNFAIRDFPVEDILIVLRDVFAVSGNKTQSANCSVLKGCFRLFRNWYAHGQFGDPPQIPDPDQLHDLCSSLSLAVIDR